MSYQLLPEGVQTHWASPENWKGEKGVAAQNIPSPPTHATAIPVEYRRCMCL
jgi:hypothetical protein